MIEELRTSAKKIVRLFNQSDPARKALKKQQADLDLPDRSLPRDNETRWNSMLNMMRALYENREAINSVLVNLRNKKVSPLKPEEWDVMKGLCDILSPFEEATVVVQSNTTPTLSQVIVVLDSLAESLTTLGDESNELDGEEESSKVPQMVLEFARSLKIALESRFRDYRRDERYMVATMADPRYKLLPVIDDPVISGLEKTIFLAEMARVTAATPQKTREVPQEGAAADMRDQSHHNEKKRQRVSLFDRFDHKRQRHIDSPDDENVTKAAQDQANAAELETYLKQPVLPRDADPLSYWRKNMLTFPNIASVARRILAIPASQAQSKRDFSTAGYVLTDRRACFSGKHLEQLVFLNRNWRV